MAHNPNVPYEIYENGAYVGLPAAQANGTGKTPFIPAAQYRETEEKYGRLRHDTREVLGRLSWAAAQRPARGSAAEDPLSGMGSLRRDMVIADLKRHGLGWFDEKSRTFGLDEDTKTILRDLRGGKKGFNTPVYNVGGHPVPAGHFDNAGNLAKTPARTCGVPGDRRAAIAARPSGIRHDLLLQKPVVPPRMPLLPR
jgi:hypothetical protein